MFPPNTKTMCEQIVNTQLKIRKICTTKFDLYSWLKYEPIAIYFHTSIMFLLFLLLFSSLRRCVVASLSFKFSFSVFKFNFKFSILNKFLTFQSDLFFLLHVPNLLRTCCMILLISTSTQPYLSSLSDTYISSSPMIKLSFGIYMSSITQLLQVIIMLKCTLISVPQSVDSSPDMMTWLFVSASISL